MQHQSKETITVFTEHFFFFFLRNVFTEHSITKKQQRNEQLSCQLIQLATHVLFIRNL